MRWLKKSEYLWVYGYLHNNHKINTDEINWLKVNKCPLI